MLYEKFLSKGKITANRSQLSSEELMQLVKTMIAKKKMALVTATARHELKFFKLRNGESLSQLKFLCFNFWTALTYNFYINFYLKLCSLKV